MTDSKFKDMLLGPTKSVGSPGSSAQGVAPKYLVVDRSRPLAKVPAAVPATSLASQTLSTGSKFKEVLHGPPAIVGVSSSSAQAAKYLVVDHSPQVGMLPSAIPAESRSLGTPAFAGMARKTLPSVGLASSLAATPTASTLLTPGTDPRSKVILHDSKIETMTVQRRELPAPVERTSGGVVGPSLACLAPLRSALASIAAANGLQQIATPDWLQAAVGQLASSGLLTSQRQHRRPPYLRTVETAFVEPIRAPDVSLNRYNIGEMSIAFARSASGVGKFFVTFNSAGHFEYPPDGRVTVYDLLWQMIRPDIEIYLRNYTPHSWARFLGTLSWVEIAGDGSTYVYHENRSPASTLRPSHASTGLLSVPPIRQWAGDVHTAAHPRDPRIVVLVTMAVSPEAFLEQDLVVAMVSADGGETFGHYSIVNERREVVDFPTVTVSDDGMIAVTWAAAGVINIRLGALGETIDWMPGEVIPESDSYDLPCVDFITRNGTTTALALSVLKAATEEAFFTGPFDVIARIADIRTDGTLVWQSEVLVSHIQRNIPTLPGGIDQWGLGINPRPTIAFRSAGGVSGSLLVAYYRVFESVDGGGNEVMVSEVDVDTLQVTDYFGNADLGQLQFFPQIVHDSATDTTALAFYGTTNPGHTEVAVFARVMRSGIWEHFSDGPFDSPIAPSFVPRAVPMFIEHPELVPYGVSSGWAQAPLEGGHYAALGDYLGLCKVPGGEAGVPFGVSGFAVAWPDQRVAGERSQQVAIQVFWSR